MRENGMSRMSRMKLAALVIYLVSGLSFCSASKCPAQERGKNPVAAPRVRGVHDPLPIPQPGYKWFRCEEMNTSFLLPASWHFRKEDHGKTIAYFISKEKIEGRDEFRTGVTINFIRKYPEHHPGKSPIDFASSLIDGYKKRGKEIKSWTAPAGKTISFGTQVLMDVQSTDPYRVHTFAVVNRETGTFYSFIFEAPESSWETEVKNAQIFVNQLALDDDL